MKKTIDIIRFLKVQGIGSRKKGRCKVVNNAKKYLSQIHRLDSVINAKLEQIQTLRSLTTKITTEISTDKVQTSHNNDKLGSTIAKIVDLENDINNDIDNLIDLKREVMNKIDSVQDKDYRLLLTLRYLNLKTWEQISIEMGFSFQWIHVLHKRSLAEFDKVLDRT